MYGVEIHKFLDACDVAVHRDQDLAQWVEVLDKSIKVVSDPIERWKKTRIIMLNSGMSLFDVFTLEQAYIKSIIKKDEKYLQGALSRPLQPKSTKEMIENISAGLIAFIKILAAIG